jgi:hypothetical protein
MRLTAKQMEVLLGSGSAVYRQSVLVARKLEAMGLGRLDGRTFTASDAGRAVLTSTEDAAKAKDVPWRSFYQACIAEDTGKTDAKDLCDIEELMRDRMGGCLDNLDRTTFRRYAKDAWLDVQACRVMGIDII